MITRKDLLFRILVGIISGIILSIWFMVIKCVVVIALLFALVTKERNRAMAEFVEIWNTQFYVYIRYMSLLSNIRPFPFIPLAKNMSDYE